MVFIGGIMKLFQIITLNGEFKGKFDVTITYNINDVVENTIEVKPSLDDLKVLYCYGDKWGSKNPTNIDENKIKKILLDNFDKVYQTLKFDDFIIKIIDDELIKDRISINKEDRTIYESIRKTDGDLKGISNMDLFLIAMMLGFHVRGRHGLKGIRSTATDGFVREGSFTDKNWDVIKSFAVYEEEYMEVLLSVNKMFDIAEKYATVGIKELNKLYFENEHNFFKRMEKLLIDDFNLNISSDEVSDNYSS